jgi:hypothetical protein
MFRSSLPRPGLPAAAGVALAVGTAGLAVAAWAVPARASSSCTTGAMVTCTYTGAGTYSFTVPAGVTSLDVTAVGAAGGNLGTGCIPNTGGAGAAVEDKAVPVGTDQGQALAVIVGGVGGTGLTADGGAGGTPGGGGAGGDYPGGTPGAICDGGGGGGFSGLLDSGTALVIGGGGGGAGGDGSGGAGGISDGDSAVDEVVASSTGGPGGGGGIGGMGGTPGGGAALGGGPGSPGTSLQGGQGGASDADSSEIRDSGGGGGGGYWGGGGGGGGGAAGGGGGGSSYGTGPGLIAAATGPASVTISYALPLTVTTASLPGGQVGSAYGPVTLAASGGVTPYTWAVSSGSLPGGLILNTSTGSISGTPTAYGTFSFTVTVSDAESPAMTATSQPLSITVKPAPLKVTTTSLAAATGGKAYSATLAATGGVTPYSWSVSSGSLPPGLSLNATTGEISGTPDVAGTYSFTVTVTDSENPAMTATATLWISVSGPVITALRPDSGPFFGLTPVLITGTGLSCPPGQRGCRVTVTFGQRRALVVLDRPTKIWVMSPAGSGTVTVTVTVGGVSSQPATFTYLWFL